MIELALLAVCCGSPLIAALMFIGIFLQGILDAIDKGREKKKKKRAKAAEKQKAEKETQTLLIRWRQ
jgi:flagellar biosynthesis component FlhA